MDQGNHSVASMKCLVDQGNHPVRLRLPPLHGGEFTASFFEVRLAFPSVEGWREATGWLPCTMRWFLEATGWLLPFA